MSWNVIRMQLQEHLRLHKVLATNLGCSSFDLLLLEQFSVTDSTQIPCHARLLPKVYLLPIIHNSV